MERLPFELPGTLDGFDAEFMTKVLRYQGLISDTNEVVRTECAAAGNFATSDAGSAPFALSQVSVTRASCPINPAPSPTVSRLNDATVVSLEIVSVWRRAAVSHVAVSSFGAAGSTSVI